MKIDAEGLKSFQLNFLFLVTKVKMDAESDKISEVLKTIAVKNPSRTFESSGDLLHFLANIIDVSFMAKCAAYEQFVKGNFSEKLISISIKKSNLDIFF